jgi:hypothetical protein
VCRVVDVPLREVSGICLRRSRNGRMSLIALNCIDAPHAKAVLGIQRPQRRMPHIMQTGWFMRLLRCTREKPPKALRLDGLVSGFASAVSKPRCAAVTLFAAIPRNNRLLAGAGL